MKQHPNVRIWLLVLTSTLSLHFEVTTQAGQEDKLGTSYVQLMTYEFGDSRAFLALIRQAIVQAQGNRAKLNAIETHLVSVLEAPDLTQAGADYACRLLWQIGSHRSVPVLAKLLLREGFHDIARYALERNTAPEAGQALRAALRQTQGVVLVGVINSLGARQDEDAVPALISLLESKDKQVAGAAAAVLGRIPSEEAFAALHERASPQDRAVAQALLACAMDMASPAKAATVYHEILNDGPTSRLCARRRYKVCCRQIPTAPGLFCAPYWRAMSRTCVLPLSVFCDRCPRSTSARFLPQI